MRQAHGLHVAVDLLLVALILVFQPLIALLWLFLLVYAGTKFAAWRAGKWVDARVDRVNDHAHDWVEDHA